MCTREIVNRIIDLEEFADGCIRLFLKLLFFLKACISLLVPYHTIYEVKCMDKDEREKGRQKKAQEKFNNVTNSDKPANQNQTHNVRKEGVGRQNNKYQEH